MASTRTLESLSERDKKYLWHPFTQMKDWAAEDVLMIEKGEGVWLIDTDGKRYLDGVSSLWCNVHGHRVAEIDQAVKDQLDRVAHTTFLGLSHPLAVELAEKLVHITPEPLTRVFYSDSGSEAVEIALKIAYQYWQQKGQKKKQKFIRLSDAYHGDTIGSVSVGGIALFHDIYRPLLFEALEAPSPHPYRWRGTDNPEKVCHQALERAEAIMKCRANEVAAFVMEPLVQGAAGMIVHPEGYLKKIRELTKRYDILLILDEVATGFGRTGSLFATEQEQVNPDILVLAKGLTGGYLPLAATLTSEALYEGFLGKYEELKTFFHGHTYTANPLACAAAVANLEIFEKKDILNTLPEKIDLIRKRLSELRDQAWVGDIRQKGLMVGIELVEDKKQKQGVPLHLKAGHRVTLKAREKGAIIRPLGNVIVLMPPLGMTQQELNQLMSVTIESINEVGKALTEKSNL